MMKRREVRRLTEILGLPLEEIGEELISVAEMQRHIMPDPRRLESFADYDIYGQTLPLSVVGGDFYDFIDLGGRFGLTGRMGIVIADACGHGLSAAMLIRDFNTALYTAISLQAHYEKDTTPLLFTKINRRMFRSSQSNQFISCFYGELRENGLIRYVNAGHFSPLLFQKGAIRELGVGGPVLGAFFEPPRPYEVGQEQMETGDVLVCFTDGIVETVNQAGEEWGVDRLRSIVCENFTLNSKALFERVVEELHAFSGGFGQKDDRTLIFIKKGLSSPSPA